MIKPHYRIFACFFLFASRIVDEGRELREEQDLVV